MGVVDRSAAHGLLGRTGALIAFVALGASLCVVATDPGIAAAQAPASGAPCTASQPGGPVFVTADCVDPDLTTPYTDVDEQRTTKDRATGVKVSYRYVHGGFRDTKSTFSFYFPSKSKYDGRFFQETYPTVSIDDASPRVIAFAISNGAYVVSTNNNGGLPAGGILAGYRTNAAAAKYSREFAEQIYDTTTPPRGYIFGASGGAYQTLAAMENTSGVYDGGVPMVSGTPNAIPSFMTVQLLGSRVLKDALPQIVDALEPGGSGDPYAGLDDAQRAALEEATRLGFPLGGWWQYRTLMGGGFAAVEGGIQVLDSTYASDFWTQPGYEGSNPTIAAARVQHDTTVKQVTGKDPITVTLADVPAGDYIGADLVITSGASAGKKLQVANVDGNAVRIASGAETATTDGVRPGDSVRLDNSWNIAMQYYQRHQVPTADQYGWNQYRGPGGSPPSPQRSQLVGEFLVKTIGGSVATGNFNGKMIMLASLLDVQAFPWASDWYKSRVVALRGAEATSANYRLWYMDHADHDPFSGSRGPAATHIVPYIGELEQALLDLDEWVADGVAPPTSTTYTVDADTQVSTPDAAAERLGLQPTVTLTVGSSGTDHTEADAGKTVKLTAKAEVPPGSGKIVAVDWDFDGSGRYPEKSKIAKPTAAATATTTHTFEKPGTYFVTVRVTAHPDGDAKDPYRRVQNLARARVTVK